MQNLTFTDIGNGTATVQTVEGSTVFIDVADIQALIAKGLTQRFRLGENPRRVVVQATPAWVLEVARLILAPTKNGTTVYANGDPLDLRRGNLSIVPPVAGPV